METIGLWATPLILLPGVALLIMSTSVRSGQLHEEFHHLLESPEEQVTDSLLTHLLYRAQLLNRALVSLYISVGLFCLGGLLGGLVSQWQQSATLIIILLVGCGVAVVFFASFQLVRESRTALAILEEHSRILMERMNL